MSIFRPTFEKHDGDTSDFPYIRPPSRKVRAATDESQKTLNKCETRNKTVFHTRLHASASPRNNKQCSAKQCFANQTNLCLADFASRSDLFLDNEHGLQNIVEKFISVISFCKPCTQPCVDWLFHTCFAENLILESSNVFFVSE